ncbi:type VI secretion system baseplate subunit TssF [Pseudomonas aeruginosa]
MNPRLLEYYNQELQHIRESAAEFAEEFPKIAGRLSLSGFECADPYVERLLEGFAYLTARVQLKLDAEYPTFTHNLLEIAYPHYLAPTPSMTVVQLRPDPNEGALSSGFSVERGASLRGQLGPDDQTACEYRTAHPVTLWPLEVAQADYGRMARNEIDTVLNLDQHLKKRIIGQDHALEMIAKRIQTSRAGLDNPSKPIGVFMLAGTSGVGKTETALALAEAMYGGEQNVITINMSEFQEAHTVSTLKGAPPGYIGYGEGGVLTEAVRRKPYSVVLLDEVEKAHPDVHEIFFQVFDKGVMEDGEGRVIDFKNTLILLTTNAGTEMIASLCADPELMPEPEAIAKSLREPLLKIFPPALLGRLVTIPYYPLSDDMLKAISRLQLGRIKKRVEATHKVPFEFDEGVVDLIVSRCTETESGGRMIDAILTNTLLPDMSREFLTRMLEGKPLAGVRISSRDNQFHYDFAEAE